MKTHDWSELISEHFETKLCWVMTMYPGLLNVIVKMIPLNDKYHFGPERGSFKIPCGHWKLGMWISQLALTVEFLSRRQDSVR